MSGHKIISGLRQAGAWAKATQGGMPTDADRAFLRRLREDKVATKTDVRCVVDRAEDRARQRCRRFGWAEFVRPTVGVSGWVLTAAGCVVLETRVHVDGPTTTPGTGEAKHG